MSDAILAVGLVLSGILLAYVTYGAIYGLAGAFTRRSYERCPNCHRHYLADRSGTVPHACAHRSQSRLQHAFQGFRHHAAH